MSTIYSLFYFHYLVSLFGNTMLYLTHNEYLPPSRLHVLCPYRHNVLTYTVQLIRDVRVTTSRATARQTLFRPF